MFSPQSRPGTPGSGFIPPTPLQRRFPAGSSRGRGDRTQRASSLSQMSIVDEASVISRPSSEMDVDGFISSKARSEVVLAQSEEQKVTSVSHLPAEVLLVLRNTDFVSDSFAGDIDTRNNFCLIASVKTCYVWKYARLLPGAPTCYIFPCPSRYSEPEVPFCALVSYETAREPGLILLSPYGELRFFDSIGLGLTGGQATNDSLLDLRSDETISGLMYAEPQTFIATSSTGRLFLLTVTTDHGRFEVSTHPFSLTRPRGPIERLRSGFWGEKHPQYTPGCITAATVIDINEEGFEVWTCTGMRVARWTVLHKGWEEFENEADVSGPLETTLREMQDRFSGINEDTPLDLELLDIVFDAQNELILFASFNAGFEDEYGFDTRPRRYYIVVKMKRDDHLTVASIRTVPYFTISSDRANIHPRLRLMNGGQIYCVQFGDVVALVARDNDYSTILALKDLRDRTFGCGVVNGSPEMLFMNSEVLMRVVLDVDRINSYNVNTWRGTSVKSIMTQQILFGANPKNPLRFEFPPDVDEEAVISGAEQLSRAVLACDPELVHPNPDLSQQLTERRDRLRFLIDFINENAALAKMSQTSRQLLVSDAEKICAVEQVWSLYCRNLNAGDDERILTEVVDMYLENAGIKHHEDAVRAFFRHEAREIYKLIPYIRHVVNKIIKDYQLSAQDPHALSRGIEYVDVMLMAAWAFRDANLGIYGIDLPMRNAWTSGPDVVDTLQDFFYFSDEVLTKFASDADNDIIRGTRQQLPLLATVLFRAFQERQEWLESSAAGAILNIDNEKRAFIEHFQKIRPQILHALLKHGESDHAFALAEQFRDFRSLVDICQATPPIYPFESNVNASRIEKYIENYREEFTDELYSWYIEHAELRCLFEQSEHYGDYIDIFLAKYPHSGVSWVHDLGKGRCGEAALTLLDQAGATLDLETRHVMLSIGKLSQITERENSGITPDSQAVLDAFHDGLDYISVHHKLLEELRAPLKGKAKLSLENQADIIVKAAAPSLKAKTHPGFYTQFRVCAKELLQNRVLRPEDLIDVLTLKESTLDFGVALVLVKEAANIPDARRVSAFRTVWRRIYIHDDWENITKTANKTDQQLVERFRKTALYETMLEALRRAYEEQDGEVSPRDLADTPNFVLPVGEAAQLPIREELESRWPGHTDELIEAQLNDYESERQRLVSVDLPPVVDRIKDLAVQQLQEEAGTGVEMAESY